MALTMPAIWLAEIAKKKDMSGNVDILLDLARIQRLRYKERIREYQPLYGSDDDVPYNFYI